MTRVEVEDERGVGSALIRSAHECTRSRRRTGEHGGIEKAVRTRVGITDVVRCNSITTKVNPQAAVTENGVTLNSVPRRRIITEDRDPGTAIVRDHVAQEAGRYTRPVNRTTNDVVGRPSLDDDAII